ncbi:hypothetical protein NX773_21605 [Massilia solisilvae]|uniref:Hemolysin XhlA n=1 Tax=Massilia solisilvae TaxID=1811225 RepID=A0ABT2BQU0_9BURK|nr:hypothetical protein [Massilia solisilvae]MCS0610771.1 hypothetical protein [Massilia solisilvae]
MGRSLDTNDGQPEDGRMEERLDKVEQRLAVLERDVAVIRSNSVTKEDLHREIGAVLREMNAQTWKILTFVAGFGTVLVSATYFIATHTK